MRFAARTIRGSGRGGTLGVPTINLDLRDIPEELIEGIYACRIHEEETGQWLPAVAHFGPRPVFRDSPSFEVHLLDRPFPTSPRALTVEVAGFIRPIRDFPSSKALTEAMRRDIERARAILTHRNQQPETSQQANIMLQLLKSVIPNRHPLRLAWHKSKAFLAALREGFPARRLTVIGITGTDGKTTTVSMVTHILRATERRVGAASTALFQINDARQENDSHLTSIRPSVLQRFLRHLLEEGYRYAVVEMSSHGLVQGRSLFTWPCVAAITNTAPEHLDYHGTMEQYRRDKGILFRMLRGRGTKVLNGRDGSFGMYQNISSERTIVYGTPSSNLWLTDIRSSPESATARLHANGQTFTLELPIPGAFNMENALCAIGCASAVGVSIADCVQALRDFHGVPGRLERIDEGQPFSVYIDFAVTPQAYEKTLLALRQIVGEKGRVLVLCSSCGNRMREKRPEIGRICSELADVVVVTEDETYGEDPRAVLEEVWAGLKKDATEAYKIEDRREAIKHILRLAQEGDAVALCGMGPFTTMTTLQGRMPWNEREIAREILRKYDGTLS